MHGRGWMRGRAIAPYGTGIAVGDRCPETRAWALLGTRWGLVVCLGILLSLPVEAQHGVSNGQWPHYAGDAGATRYSPLDDIRRDNVQGLAIAWRWESVDAAVEETHEGLRQGPFKPTPLYVDGVLYTSTSFSQVAAIDPGSGETLWVHDSKSYEAGRPANAGFQHRGVESWRDGEKLRLFIATGARQLIALDAKTGQPVPGFGQEGRVDLSQGLGREINPRYYTVNSPPVACGDTVVVGSVIFDAPPGTRMPPGHVRGYDARSGRQKWIFHTIPQQGELGVETWKNGSWEYSGNTNVWSTMSCDPELGLVYLPVSTPTNDWYGGHRLGDNLFAESLVALEADTGKRVWHFQAVHHGLWDYDFPCSPNLVNITVDGRKIKAVAQVSKQGFCYVFDRKSGEPVWPIEERPVPPSKVPGEEAAATQPFPTRPPPFERQGVSLDDVVDFTPELKREALETLSRYEIGPLFTPPMELRDDNPKKGTLMLPSAAGGANWGGAAFDPETGVLYVPSMTLVMINAVTKASGRSSFRYIRAPVFLPEGPQGLPLVKPPYGRISAIDLNRGEILWQVPHGDGPRDHPALRHLDLGPLGSASHGVLSNGGAIVTKTLLFAIQPVEDPDPGNFMRVGEEGYLRAWDKKTGELVWETRFSPTPHGTPMTYHHEGKQYIVLSAGGGAQKAELLAFALQ